MLRYLFFDFGGCIDAPGIHTRTLFWNAFQNNNVLSPERNKEYQDAYGLADKRMMSSGMAKGMGLQPFNRLQATLIAEAMKVRSPNIIHAADEITHLMRGHIAKSAVALAELAQRYPLGIISNFTGNLEVIMKEEGIRSLFDSVTESFYVGASKPDLGIFKAALSKQPHRPEDCLYVGDNPRNDIAPAKAVGMKSVLIHEKGKREDCGADAYISALADLLERLEKIQRP